MSFILPAEVMKEIREIVDRYPQREAALLPVLHILQRTAGALTPAEESLAAEILGLNPVRVREVVSFYSLFRTQAAGRHIIQVCRNLSCSLAGAEGILEKLKDKLAIGPGETTPDGQITLIAVECLGNCDHAPCLMVDGQDCGPVTEKMIDEILERIKNEGAEKRP